MENRSLARQVSDIPGSLEDSRFMVERAINDLVKEIESLEDDNKSLQSRIEELEWEIESLKDEIAALNEAL